MVAKRDEVVVVTGASAGVGRAIAERFARDGAKVALIAREPRRLEETAAACQSLGSPQALALPADVADAAALRAAADRAEALLGPIDVWVNSAMVTVYSLFQEMTAEEFHRVTDVTYLGQVNGTRIALDLMRPRDRGVILLVGSALAYRGLPLQAAYSGAKFATRGFFEALRSELLDQRSHIHLGMVQMPAMNTPQFDWARSRLSHMPQPVPPIYQPEPCADAVVGAVRQRRREVWVARSSVQLAVGSMVAPGAYMDAKLAAEGIPGQHGDAPDPAAAGGAPRPDNLFDPVPGFQGAHGRFDAQAETSVRSLDPDWLRAGAGVLAAGVALVAGVAAVGAYMAGKRRSRDPWRQS